MTQTSTSLILFHAIIKCIFWKHQNKTIQQTENNLKHLYNAYNFELINEALFVHFYKVFQENVVLPLCHRSISFSLEVEALQHKILKTSQKYHLSWERTSKHIYSKNFCDTNFFHKFNPSPCNFNHWWVKLQSRSTFRQYFVRIYLQPFFVPLFPQVLLSIAYHCTGSELGTACTDILQSPAVKPSAWFFPNCRIFSAMSITSVLVFRLATRSRRILAPPSFSSIGQYRSPTDEIQCT